MTNPLIRILLVDDDIEEAILLRHHLKNSIYSVDYQIEQVYDMEQALLALQTGSFDACLVDYNMPKENGLTIISNISKRYPALPCIIQTGQGNSEIDIQAMRLGATDFLLKDTSDPSLLERSIRYAMQQKATEKRLLQLLSENQRLSVLDPVTTLYNRNQFNQVLPVMLSRATRNNFKVGMLYIDLDKFKEINDTYGHDVGDGVLQQFAERMKQELRKTDYLFRLGGDEFAVLFEGDFSPYDAAVLAEKVITLTNKPFVIDDNVIYSHTSVGIALSDSPAADKEAMSLPIQADAAMYKAKKSGGGYQFFTDDIHQEVVHRHKASCELKAAINSKQFYLVYQPIVNVKTLKIDYAEALLRWHNAELNIATGDLITLAEESGVIVNLGRWILDTACLQLAQWQKQNLLADSFHLAVNVSMHQLHDKSFMTHLEHTLNRTQVDPKQLTIELTESSVMSNPTQCIDTLNALHSNNISIAIDDFGTGYSSLSYLQRLPIDQLKIDGSFIMPIIEQPKNSMIVKAISTLATGLELDVVAECVETDAHFAAIKDCGCQHAQGFLFHRPMLATELQQLLQH